MLGGGGAGGMFTSKAGGTGLGLSLGQVRRRRRNAEKYCCRDALALGCTLVCLLTVESEVLVLRFDLVLSLYCSRLVFWEAVWEVEVLVVGSGPPLWAEA